MQATPSHIKRDSQSPAQSVIQRLDEGRALRLTQNVIHVKGTQSLAVMHKRLPKGNPRAALILVHGFGQNRHAWHIPQRSFENHLVSEGFEVFSADLRGHGESAARFG